MVKDKRPVLVFLMKTKLCINKMERIRIKVGFNNMFVVDCVGRSGGLSLLWNNELNLEIQNYNCRHINATIKTDGVVSGWKFTSFYGHSKATKRQGHGVG